MHVCLLKMLCSVSCLACHLLPYHHSQACNGFAHSNGDVREAYEELTVAVNALCSNDPNLVEKHLATLRPKQLEEYRDTFKG